MKIVEDGDGPDSVSDVSTTPAMITQDPPVLQTGDGVLDAGPPPAMTAPCVVAEDPIATKRQCRELGNAAIAAIREDASVLLASWFDTRPSVVDRIISVTWTSRADRNDA